MRAAAVATIALALLSASAAGSTATLSGRVVDGATHRPVRGAVVSLFYMGKRIGTVSGPEGGFVLTGLQAGVWRLTATKSGYFEGAYGRRRIGAEDEPVALADGAGVSNVEILMWAEAMISGTVVDEAGDPVAGVRLIAMPRDGDWNLGSNPFAVTDATGRYAIGKLRPGSYVVGTTVFYVFAADVALPAMAGPGQVTVSGALVPPFVMAGGRRNVYTGTLHSDAESTSTASVVALTAGEEHSGIDLRLPLRSTVRVSGRVIVPGTFTNPGLVVFSNDVVRLVAPLTGDGNFSFAAVPAGRYAIDVSGALATRVAGSVVVGDQDLSNLAITAARDATVSGLIQAPTRLPSGLLVLLTTPGTVRSVSTRAIDGRLTFSDVAPGRYVVRLGADPNWTTESVDLAGRDVSDTSFDDDDNLDGLVIHATNQPARVSGKVRLANGSIAHGAAIVIFPSDTSQWDAVMAAKPIRFQRARPTNGEYVIPALPAGDYFIAAVDDALLEDWPQRALLSTLAGSAEHVRLAQGDAVVRNLVMKDR